VLDQFDLKIACITANIGNFRKRQQFDIDVPADLDQFGRDDSHGTVIGWECFVQLGHHPPDRARPFHEVDIETGVGQIQGSLHSGDTAADYHHCTYCFS
jgi:hypothetical protein